MKRVIIIGAGPAGITAGYELLKQSKEYEVTILEESAQVGGISRTVYYNGNRMDIGGHRFFSKDDRVNRWWMEILPRQGAPAYDYKKLKRHVPLVRGGADPEISDKVFLVRNRVSRIYYRHKFFDYPVKMNQNTIRNMGFLTTCAAGFSYICSCVFKKPETSLENFYINRFGKKLYMMFFEGYTEKLWGRHPREISADWGAQRVKGLSVLALIKDMVFKLLPHRRNNVKKVETSLIEEFYYPKYGPGQLWEEACADFLAMGGRLIKNAKVTYVCNEGESVRSVTCADGTTYEGDIFLSSMPLKDLVAGMKDIPDNVAKVAAGLPYRDFVTVGLLLEKLNIKNQTKIRTLGNIVPDCWIYVQDTGVKLGRIQIFNNWSPYMVAKPEETVWIGLEYFCNENDAYWNKNEEEWVSLASEELVKMGIISSSDAILDAHMEKVKKAYPAYFDTYNRIDEVVSYLNTLENLYCIGRNGQHRYNNMDHSMATAFEAVGNILSGGAKDKSAIWNVNTDKEYHEQKHA